MRSGDLVGVVVMAHGTPSRLEDVAAFYTDIRRGRPPSAEQLAELEGRYRAIGGPSPLNDITRRQAEQVARALEVGAPGRFVVRQGARFAAPRIEEAVDALADAGARRLVGLVLAPHSSSASVAQYARRARAAAQAAASRLRRELPLVMVDHFYDAPGFVDLVAARVMAALSGLSTEAAPAWVVFTAHSVPARLVAEGDSYPEQLAASALAVAEAGGLERWEVGWQSAGRTDDEWLGPDVRQVIADLADRGAGAVVVCPIGFVSDHLEVLYDVDVEARAAAEAHGLGFARTASFNDDGDFCALLARVILAAADDGEGAAADAEDARDRRSPAS